MHRQRFVIKDACDDVFYFIISVESDFAIRSLSVQDSELLNEGKEENDTMLLYDFVQFYTQCTADCSFADRKDLQKYNFGFMLGIAANYKWY